MALEKRKDSFTKVRDCADSFRVFIARGICLGEEEEEVGKD